MTNDTIEIKQGLSALGLPQDDSTISVFNLYLSELDSWNKRYGFIKADRSGLVRLHLLDALAGLSLLRTLAPSGTLLDFGSGAGFPGLPLAICLPGRPFVLCERKSTERAFLENMRLLLKLEHVTVTDDIATQADGSLSAVVFRAVTSLDGILSRVRTYLAPGGLLFAYKGTRDKVEEELDRIADLGLTTEVHPLSVPGIERERHIVVVRV